MSIHSPPGREHIVLTQSSTISHRAVPEVKVIDNVTQTTTVVINSDASFISGCTTTCESTTFATGTSDHEVISAQNLTVDEDGNIAGISSEMAGVVETIKNDGLEGGLIDSKLNAKDGAMIGAAGAFIEGAGQNRAKLGPLGKIAQAAGVGAAIGDVVGDLLPINLQIISTKEKMDPNEAERMINTIKGNND